MALTRRRLLGLMAAGAAGGVLAGCSFTGGSRAGAGRVVVIGGGFAGATAAKYIRMWGGDIDVTLIERNAEFISCPISNLVLGGHRSIADVTMGYGGLDRYGVKRVRDEVVGIDPARRVVRTATGGELGYDRLIVAPGVDFIPGAIEGLDTPRAQERILHAWKAGAQTVALRKQLEAMADGGVYVLSIPLAPFRCPPGPYERACQVASYFKQAKPRSKVLILDANEDVVSKKGLFTKSWKDQYGSIVEYRNNQKVIAVDADALAAKTDFDTIKASVLNVVPNQRAGAVAAVAGVVNVNNRWCEVDWLTCESTVQKGIHVLGDATLSAPGMPKSGHMANQQAKVCAAAVVNLLRGRPVNPEPMVTNTCYSYVDGEQAMHVASVHKYDKEKRTFVTVPGSGGVSAAAGVQEGEFANGWARNIWADMLG